LEIQLNHEVKFSKHALDRINSRGIQLSNSELQGLRQAVGKASDKGLKESLVMLKDTALIVSIRNKTVITALKKESLKDRIITNVDGVVIL
jgi:flagellar operon protein